MKPQLNRIQTFLAVVECGSFSRAAEQLYISKSVASIHIKALEEELRVPLLIRNTRGFALTEAGKVFYDDFKAIFSDIRTALEHVSDRHLQVSGSLRVTSTAEFGERFLLPLITRFCTNNPELEVGYFADSSLSDLVTDQIDLAIRLGTLEDSGLKSRRLARYNLKLVASPTWLQQHPLDSVTQLSDVAWIANSNLQYPTRWLLHGPGGEPLTVRGRARYVSNAPPAICQMALAGLGVAVLPEWTAREPLAAGQLVELFPDYRLPSQDITAVFHNNGALPRKSRLFVDYLVENLSLV